jgi:hypothetical protein
MIKVDLILHAKKTSFSSRNTSKTIVKGFILNIRIYIQILYDLLQVINTLQRAVSCTHKEAVDFATTVDKEVIANIFV